MFISFLYFQVGTTSVFSTSSSRMRTPALSLLLLWAVTSATQATDIEQACFNFCNSLEYKVDAKIKNCRQYCEETITARLYGAEETEVVPADDVYQEVEEEPDVSGMEKRRQSSFVRIGKSGTMPQRRVSSFVRIGKARPSSFVRIGKARPSSFVRVGKAKPSSFVRIGKARPSSFVRIGKKNDLNGQLIDDGLEEPMEEKRTSNFVRIGRSPSSFVRIGKSQYQNPDMASSLEHFLRQSKARSSAFVRIGKKDAEDQQDSNDEAKRTSSFVRIGKASSFVRIGKSDPEMEEEKRARPSSFVRIGKSDADSLADAEKRTSSFVRIGKSSDIAEPLDEEEKRTSSFVRIGKSGQYPDYKRVSSFVRIGKKSDNDETLEEAKRRASSFVRIGKAMPSVEAQDDSLQNEADLDEKRASSFVRIGKRSLEEAET